MSKTIYAVGDCSANAAGGSTLNRNCKALVPAAGSLDQMWFLGDVYSDGTNAQFTNDFDPLWGSYKSATKLYSTPGNHGWANHTTGWDVYHSALMTTWGGKHYGSYTLGDWMIIWVNSMEGASTAVSPVPESSIVLGQTSGPAKDMLTWLSGLFTANPGTNKILVCHHNIWASGGHNDISQMQPLWQMLPGNVSIVLTGHTHNMEVHQPRNAGGSVVAFNDGAGTGAGATIAVLAALAGNVDALDPTYTPAPSYATSTSPAKAGVLKIILSDGGLANPTADLTFLGTDASTVAIPQIVSAAAAPGGTAPTNATLPVISDTTPVVGQLITTGGGIWTGSPLPTLTYQWQVSNTGTGGWSSATGSGATTNAYTVASGDNTKFLRVVVTGTNASGSAVADSAATSAVASAPSVPVNTVQPVVTDGAGNDPPIVGDVLTTTNGTWSNTPTSFTRTWTRRDPTSGSTFAVSGATGASYTITTTDLGFQLRANTTAHNGSGASDPAPSAWLDTTSAPGTGLQPGVTQAGGVYTVQVSLAATPGVGLTVTLDDQNARAELIVNAAGMASTTITRTHPSGMVWTVRGCDQAPTAGDTFIAYDYELPIGRDCTYVAEAWDGDTTDLGVSMGVDIIWNTEQEYLKDPALPARNMPVLVSAMDLGTFLTPLTVLPVIGRPNPVTLGDVRQSQTGDLGIVTRSLDDALRLHELTASGHVLLLQSTPDSEIGNMYLAMSSIAEVRPSLRRDEPVRLWTLTYQETDPPVGGISGGFPTYQTVLDLEESYQDLIDDFASYLILLQNVGAGTTPPVVDIAWRGA